MYAEGAVQRMQAATNYPQKQTLDPAVSNSDTLFDSVVTVQLANSNKTTEKRGESKQLCRSQHPR